MSTPPSNAKSRYAREMQVVIREHPPHTYQTTMSRRYSHEMSVVIRGVLWLGRLGKVRSGKLCCVTCP